MSLVRVNECDLAQHRPRSSKDSTCRLDHHRAVYINYRQIETVVEFFASLSEEHAKTVVSWVLMEKEWVVMTRKEAPTKEAGLLHSQLCFRVSQPHLKIF